MKTLVSILHYNSPQYTDTLYEILKPYEKTEYDLIVIDNGSKPNRSSKYSTFKIDENIFYGGGLDVNIKYFLENPQYDSLLVLNSDIILHGNNFIKSLREELFSEEDLVAVSGCVLQPEKNQCHWKMVHNWGSKNIRYVPWVDYQCVLLKRKFLEEVKQFNSQFGWVQDIMTGIICQKNNWKIGVCDWLPLIHFGNGTVKDNQDDPIIRQYNQLAEQEMIKYFQDNNLWQEFIQMRQLAENYKYDITNNSFV